MVQIRANTPAPIKDSLMTEQLSVQMSWGNGDCTRACSPGDQQSRELGPWATRRFRAMMRTNAWGHDELRNENKNHCGLFVCCMLYITSNFAENTYYEIMSIRYWKKVSLCFSHHFYINWSLYYVSFWFAIYISKCCNMYVLLVLW